MQINKSEKEFLIRALETEIARVKRAANTQCSPGIKDILGQEMQALVLLHGRVFNEVAK